MKLGTDDLWFIEKFNARFGCEVTKENFIEIRKSYSKIRESFFGEGLTYSEIESGFRQMKRKIGKSRMKNELVSFGYFRDYMLWKKGGRNFTDLENVEWLTEFFIDEYRNQKIKELLKK